MLWTWGVTTGAMTTTQTPASTALSATDRARLPMWDNARFIAVTLVVIGHAIQPLAKDSDSAFTMYVMIYAFHMPAFALISGYFSKAEPATKQSMTRVFSTLLVPYFVMEALWALVKFLVSGEASFDPTEPSWTLWFLLALAIFRMVLPYLALVRWPLSLAVAVSIGSGYLAGIDSTFALARTLGFLPFFVLGWKLSRTSIVGWWLSLDKTVWLVRLAAVAVFGIFAVTIASWVHVLRAASAQHWLFYDETYARLGNDSVFAGGIRALLLCLAVILCAAFLSLMPRGHSAITRLGTATMYVYLLHSFVLYPIRESVGSGGDHSSSLLLVALCAAAVALSVLLASEPIRRFFGPVVSPNSRWLFARDALDPEGSLPRVSPRVDLGRRRS